MEDEQIIELYFQRSEDAIRQTEAAHGHKLYTLSYCVAVPPPTRLTPGHLPPGGRYFAVPLMLQAPFSRPAY